MLVFVLTPNRIKRDALVRELRSFQDLHVVADCEPEMVLSRFHDLHPQVLLLDALFPRAMQVAVAARLCAPHLRVVIQAAEDSDEAFRAWASTGISGYVRPQATVTDVRDALRRSLSGELACVPRRPVVSARRHSTQDGKSGTAPEGLTGREREILDLVAEGMANKVIARRLAISDATVKNHIHNILAKLNARNRTQAAAHFRRTMIGQSATAVAGGMPI